MKAKPPTSTESKILSRQSFSSSKTFCQYFGKGNINRKISWKNHSFKEKTGARKSFSGRD